MSTFQKVLEKMRRNPRADWTMETLLSIAFRIGIEVRNSDGSHHVFSFPGVEEDISIPFRRPVKPLYIKKFLALVDAVNEVSTS